MTRTSHYPQGMLISLTSPLLPAVGMAIMTFGALKVHGMRHHETPDPGRTLAHIPLTESFTAGAHRQTA